MARDIPIGNGNILIAFDKNYLMRELYFPHVGEENHTNGEPFRFGIWENNQMKWVPDGWNIHKEYLDDSLVTSVKMESGSQALSIIANDFVDFHENIYVKKLTIQNLTDQERSLRLFFSQDFHIYGNDIGDTAEYRPENKSLLHYKAKRYFLINVFANGKVGIDQFATGYKPPGIYQGTWKDAEDGVLSGNPIAQGSVDSTLCIPIQLAPKETQSCYYWICCASSWEEVKNLQEIIQRKGPEELLKRTKNYWSLWVNKEGINEQLLPPAVFNLYKKSLLIVRSQINNCGSIIAANDSDSVHFNRDTYSYMWPRDGALVAYALDLAKYGITTSFYQFCARVIEKKGYFLHKYTPSGSLASSWHPWFKDNKEQLPIQEDETALVLWALWKHYKNFKDVEFIKPLYKPLIKRTADFMVSYRDEKTKLPLPSYDLWEEKLGVSTFTSAAIYGGLKAAAEFATAFGEIDLASKYNECALQMKQAVDQYLYLPEEKRFAKMLYFKEDGSIEVDKTIDASFYALFAFGMYCPHDEKVKNTMEQIKDKLWNPEKGGLARYENDSFYKSNHGKQGNTWFVTTLWLAQYYIAISKEDKDLDKALQLLYWVAQNALPSGVLSEQLDPISGEQTSVSPLTWSHGTYIAVVQEYLNKLLELEICPTCKLSRVTKVICNDH